MIFIWSYEKRNYNLHVPTPLPSLLIEGREDLLNIQRVSSKTKELRESIAFQASARKQMKLLFEGLIDLAFDYGLDTIELVDLVREVSILRAVKRQSPAGERVSISRIAVVTGISRGEISSFLKSESTAKSRVLFHEGVLNRVLKGWRSDPAFLSNRRPKPLKLFGKTTSFESLVKIYGRGIPVRAILDELVTIEAIEVLPSQTAILRKPVAINDRATRKGQALIGQVIELFGGTPSYQSTIDAKSNSRPARRNFKRTASI